MWLFLSKGLLSAHINTHKQSYETYYTHTHTHSRHNFISLEASDYATLAALALKARSLHPYCSLGAKGLHLCARYPCLVLNMDMLGIKLYSSSDREAQKPFKRFFLFAKISSTIKLILFQFDFLFTVFI